MQVCEDRGNAGGSCDGHYAWAVACSAVSTGFTLIYVLLTIFKTGWAKVSAPWL